MNEKWGENKNNPKNKIEKHACTFMLTHLSLFKTNKQKNKQNLL